jgi:hypothetical protein
MNVYCKDCNFRIFWEDLGQDCCQLSEKKIETSSYYCEPSEEIIYKTCSSLNYDNNCKNFQHKSSLYQPSLWKRFKDKLFRTKDHI